MHKCPWWWRRCRWRPSRCPCHGILPLGGIKLIVACPVPDGGEHLGWGRRQNSPFTQRRPGRPRACRSDRRSLLNSELCCTNGPCPVVLGHIALVADACWQVGLHVSEGLGPTPVAVQLAQWLHVRPVVALDTICHAPGTSDRSPCRPPRRRGLSLGVSGPTASTKHRSSSRRSLVRLLDLDLISMLQSIAYLLAEWVMRYLYLKFVCIFTTLQLILFVYLHMHVQQQQSLVYRFTF